MRPTSLSRSRLRALALSEERLGMWNLTYPGYPAAEITATPPSASEWIPTRPTERQSTVQVDRLGVRSQAETPAGSGVEFALVVGPAAPLRRPLSTECEVAIYNVAVEFTGTEFAECVRP